MKSKSSIYITVDHRNQEVEDLLWWIEEQDTFIDEEDNFNMDDLDNCDFSIEGGGIVET